MRSFFHDDDDEDDGRKRATWKSFFELFDKAMILCEEQRPLVAVKENSEEEEEEEEESRRRIFFHFPRKLRSSLKEPNHLIGLNHTPIDSKSSQDYLEWLPSPSRIAALQYPSSGESFSLPSLVEYNSTDESETTKTSLVNKPEDESPQVVVREKPSWLVQLMSNMEGATEATLIFEKSLFVTDVNRTQNRLSMPYKGIVHKDFLTDVELEIIEQDIGVKKKTGVNAILVNQNGVEWEVKLKRWEMNHSWNYTLVGGWYAFVKANEFKAGDNICVWTFRCSGVRYFALEKTT